MVARRLAAKLALAALLAAAAAPARASEAGAAAAPPRIRFHLDEGWDYGFTKLVTAEMSDGSTRTINANQGLSLHLGAEYALDSASIRATAGIEASVILASNGDIWSYSYPLELLAFYDLPRVRLGGGLSLALAPRVVGTKDASALDARFDPSLGVVLQAEWVFRRTAGGASMSLGARFTLQRYRLTATGETVGGNAAGLVLGWTP